MPNTSPLRPGAEAIHPIMRSEFDQASSDSTAGALIVLLGDKEQNVAGKTSADANYEQQDSEPTKNDHRVDYTFPKSRTHKRQFARLTVLMVKKSSSKRWFKCRSQELFFLFFFSFLYFYFYFLVYPEMTVSISKYTHVFANKR